MPLPFHLDPPLTPTLHDGILTLWTDVTNPGGPVGFVPPATRETNRPDLLNHLTARAEGRHRLLLGMEDTGTP
ncbi:GNAT family N-acetyltransferase, partial [Streptomyces sp. SP17KL33]|nr:GNAT family N-acetyltransferase [Streptomyces sp. SP17KL33]